METYPLRLMTLTQSFLLKEIDFQCQESKRKLISLRLAILARLSLLLEVDSHMPQKSKRQENRLLKSLSWFFKNIWKINLIFLFDQKSKILIKIFLIYVFFHKKNNKYNIIILELCILYLCIFFRKFVEKEYLLI